jgi:MoxR-like ATPase
LTNLQQLLKIKPNGKIEEEFMKLKYPKEMNSVELMDELLELIKGRMLSLDLIHKILSEYALTPDNFIKMILILDRINCDIPVILMGETGCGKTSLIKILANIIFKGNLKDNLKILNIHSGIEDNEIIKFLELIIRQTEMSDNMKLTSMKDEYNSLPKEQKQNYLNAKKMTEEILFKDLRKQEDEQKIWEFLDEINS